MKIKLEKFGFESMNFAIPVQCSTNRANICTGFEPITSSISAQCSTNWANMIFIYSLHWFITNQHYDKLPIGLLAQCRPEFFHYCSLLRRSLSYSFLNPQFTYMTSYIHSHWFITSRVYYEANIITAPSRLASSVGRALHWCRKGHGFKSCTGLSKIVETYSVV